MCVTDEAARPMFDRRIAVKALYQIGGALRSYRTLNV